ncbi:hypothetical protein FA95DRAFT_1608486 [Auriscalpium vulgare]|uniref:Uncharacterized protein n=1 Tax=Auriscalpium vulgare TaxID=40419 RepID=A0ACB8RKQ7_9AGAM|nr:hypothetical protein FA95DRAFT_1608486 [Auriscalpium vulgare]
MHCPVALLVLAASAVACTAAVLPRVGAHQPDKSARDVVNLVDFLKALNAPVDSRDFRLGGSAAEGADATSRRALGERFDIPDYLRNLILPDVHTYH